MLAPLQRDGTVTRINSLFDEYFEVVQEKDTWSKGAGVASAAAAAAAAALVASSGSGATGGHAASSSLSSSAYFAVAGLGNTADVAPTPSAKRARLGSGDAADQSAMHQGASASRTAAASGIGGSTSPGPHGAGAAGAPAPASPSNSAPYKRSTAAAARVPTAVTSVTAMTARSASSSSHFGARAGHQGSSGSTSHRAGSSHAAQSAASATSHSSSSHAHTTFTVKEGGIVEVVRLRRGVGLPSYFAGDFCATEAERMIRDWHKKLAARGARAASQLAGQALGGPITTGGGGAGSGNGGGGAFGHFAGAGVNPVQALSHQSHQHQQLLLAASSAVSRGLPPAGSAAGSGPANTRGHSSSASHVPSSSPTRGVSSASAATAPAATSSASSAAPPSLRKRKSSADQPRTVAGTLSKGGERPSPPHASPTASSAASATGSAAASTTLGTTHLLDFVSKNPPVLSHGGHNIRVGDVMMPSHPIAALGARLKDMQREIFVVHLAPVHVGRGRARTAAMAAASAAGKAAGDAEGDAPDGEDDEGRAGAGTGGGGGGRRATRGSLASSTLAHRGTRGGANAHSRGLSESEDTDVEVARAQVAMSLNDAIEDERTITCDFFDSRHGFLRMCQGNNYQFDTLRRAKHSSMMILFHLHNPAIPAYAHTCNKCETDIGCGTRWHCEACFDFDICDACRNNPDVQHPHELVAKLDSVTIALVDSAGTGAGAGAAGASIATSRPRRGERTAAPSRVKKW